MDEACEGALEEMGSADFKLFLALWNQRQNLTTPDLHFRIADWLEASWDLGLRELLLMVFRSAGKSTLTGVFCAWLLYRDPNLRILVLAADQALAGKMVRNVKRVIERHPLCAGMRPRSADQWASDRFTVNRVMELRDPSMLARGVSANLTGSRADIVICDDVEVPNTCDSAEKREELRSRLAEVRYVLAAGGVQLYIGTPHHYYSIYAHEPRRDLGEEAPFLDGFERLEIPALDDRGCSAWPERYSVEELGRIRERTGPAKFASQMMLMPTNVADGRLDPDLLHVYEGALEYRPEIRALFVGGVRMVRASAYWDPAFGLKSGDASVLAVVFMDEEGRRYVHRLAYLTVDQALGVDEATQQCTQVIDLLRVLRVPVVAVERNGLGSFLPGMLRRMLGEARVVCAVREVNNTRSKVLRILEAFDAPLAAQRLYVHEDVCQTPFMAEMREWRPEGYRGHDDGLDAVAGALAQEPDRLKRLYMPVDGGQVWMELGAEVYQAETVDDGVFDF